MNGIRERAASRYPADQHGRCFSCGFLAAHNNRWHEVIDEDRVRGNLTRDFGTGYEREVNTRPACFRHAFDLGSEWQREVDKLKSTEQASMAADLASTAVMQTDRHCDDWYPYTPGFSPKEHLEELRAHEMEEDRQRFQRDMAAIEGRFQAFSKRWTITAVVVGVIAALIGATGVIFTALEYFAVHH